MASKGFPHRMARETDLQEIPQLPDTGINNGQIIDLSLAAPQKKGKLETVWFSTVLFHMKCFRYTIDIIWL